MRKNPKTQNISISTQSRPSLATKDWIWIISIMVGATFGLVVYAQANFMSKDDKIDIRDDISEIKSQLIRINDKFDRLSERIGDR